MTVPLVRGPLVAYRATEYVVLGVSWLSWCSCLVPSTRKVSAVTEGAEGGKKGGTLEVGGFLSLE